MSYLTYHNIGDPLLSDSVIKPIINRVVWQLFEYIKDESYKFKIGFIPVSIKISKLDFIIERLVGPRPK